MTRHISLRPLMTERIVGMRSKATPVRREVESALDAGQDVELDFAGVVATQSFVDELVGLLVLERGPEVFKCVRFRNCSKELQGIVRFVTTDRAGQYREQVH